MLFNSIEFCLFLPVVFILYWFVVGRSFKLQNALLIVASYFFYGWWDFRFLGLLFFSTFLDYYTGIKISDSLNQNQRKFWFWLSILVNVGFLGFFKYYNFFIDSFATLLTAVGFRTHIWTLNIILPIGISFYTFHGLSYVIDIYKGKIRPERNFIDYALFVSFFPLLVAGPIERATHLLPQLQRKRYFSSIKATDGLRQILWGLFKKIVIADNCAELVNVYFSNHSTYPGSSLLIGALLFTFQIYCDFSGYSDIALGVARLFGIELLRNFSYPYFSRDIAEFWRRWHISLSSWFKDYLYIPLGGSKGSTALKVRNTFIIFLVSGFWHGANWTFIVWGTLHALFFLPLLLASKNRVNLEIVAYNRVWPNMKEITSMLMTFSLVVFAWIFFRAETVGQAISYLSGIFSASFFSAPIINTNLILVIIFILILIVIEWMGREQEYAIANLGLRWPRVYRWLFYYSLITLILFFTGKEQEFIYFQF